MPRGRDFFESTFGFRELDYMTTQQRLLALADFTPAQPSDMINIDTLPVAPERCVFRVDDQAQTAIDAGIFYEPSVDELRREVAALLRSDDLAPRVAEAGATMRAQNGGKLIVVRNLVGDARNLHLQPKLAHSVFQAASQFNYLEFPGPSVTPEHGITGYAHDHTQGPSCAMACAPGTAYRNYLLQPLPSWTDQVDASQPVVVSAARGQVKLRQRDGLSEVHQRVWEQIRAKAAREPDGDAAASPASVPSPWVVRNGYIESTPARLGSADHILRHPAQRAELQGLLRVGVHQNTVTVNGGDISHPVTQVYCSACSCGYSRCPTDSWTPLATLVLDAAYEATLLVAVKNNLRMIRHPPAGAAVAFPPVLLTKVGGGVFGNRTEWIMSAISNAVRAVARYGVPLDVRVVHYGQVDSDYAEATVRSWSL